MDQRLHPLGEIFRLNRRLILNCFDGMTEEQARMRAGGTTNSALFLLAHLIDVRHFLLQGLGGRVPNPVASALAGARGIDDVTELPPLATLVDAWTEVADALEAALASARGEALERPAAQRFPVDDSTLLGEIAFLAQHESYHVGQIAMLRRVVGLPAMRYGAREPAGT
jgi:uncharacterized damage-inducible protein DinB